MTWLTLIFNLVIYFLKLLFSLDTSIIRAVNVNCIPSINGSTASITLPAVGDWWANNLTYNRNIANNSDIIKKNIPVNRNSATG